MKITEKQIKGLAQKAAQRTCHDLIGSTDIDRLVALEAAKDAGDAFAARLDLTLREHDVEVSTRIS